MDTLIRDSSGTTDLSEIERVEQLAGARLPSEYRNFLLRHNGGYPDPDGFLFKDLSDGSSVDRFLSIGSGEHSNLEKYLITYQGRFPVDFLPIAHDPGGNLVLIGTSGGHSGKIYFWDHEYEADGSEPDMSNMHLVAQSFSEFLNGLFEVAVD